MGVPTIEEGKQETADLVPTMQNLMEDDPYIMDFPRKKKMFSSSSFYEEPNAIYPTVEEQVEMCRRIADSLSDDCNKKSRGANMFFRRVKKAEKWIVESNEYDSDTRLSEGSDPSSMPYVRVSKGPPKLKLILDPRHIVDMRSLRNEGISIVEHNAVSPELCHDIVKDLNSPTGKGAQLFAKRKKKSEEWIVDEEKVRALLREKHGWEDGSLSPELPIKPLTHPRVQSIKSPWEDPRSLRSNVSSEDLVDSVIRAAEAKIMTYPSKRYSAIEPVAQYCDNFGTLPSFLSYERLSTPTFSTRSDVYSSRAPRGWMSGSFTSNISNPSTTPELMNNLLPNDSLASKSSAVSPIPYRSSHHDYPTSRTMSFSNFNKTAKAWSPYGPSYDQIKPVRPPSVLL